MRTLRAIWLAGPCLLGACAAPVPDEPLDWLVDDISAVAQVLVAADGASLELTNGLVRRSFSTAPDGATLALDDLMTGASLVRAVRPEARLTVDGVELAVGGLTGQPDAAYLRPDWERELAADPAALHLVDWSEGPTEAPFAWERARHGEDRPWPPPGRRLTLSFAGRGLHVDVVHELYDGLPLLGKWLVVRNDGERPVQLQRFAVEELAIVEAESHVDPSTAWRMPQLTVRCDYSFGGMSNAALERSVRWLPDPSYSTQVNYERKTPNLLVVEPELGPDATLAVGEALTTFRSFLLVHDSSERERQGLAERRMWRTLAPWTTENPLMMHVRSADPDAVRLAIDQCVDVGFEMVILTFGSGFDIEDRSDANIARWKELADYAHERGIQLGGYSLLASRAVSEADDVIDLATGERGHARFGNSPCLESAWGQRYFETLYAFYDATGFDLLEHDGNYPGDTCASSDHPGHVGHADSQWTQWRRITDFYQWCRGRGVYLNVPDCYMLAGSNKVGMGYRETNWSLPRAEQVLHGRQNIYDGTWNKPPTMGWMFVPLTEYHGGGAAATLEPLSEHLDAYEAHLANNLAAGVQACWRGPRLYDTEQTRALVSKWVTWFKRHRPILESDVIHLRRPDGRDLDMLLHVNPTTDERAMLVVFNPLDHAVTKSVRVPLRYAGLTGRATVRAAAPDVETGGHAGAATVRLDAARAATIEVTVAGGTMGAWVFEED